MTMCKCKKKNVKKSPWNLLEFNRGEKLAKWEWENCSGKSDCQTWNFKM